MSASFKSPLNKETVVLLHGIGHNKMFMMFIAHALKKKGYKTENISYPSRHHIIEELAQWLKQDLDSRNVWNISDKVHFVAHSMGGLVSGMMLERYKDDLPKKKIGRVVMLGTPLKGSEVANGLKNWWLYKVIFGPAGQELTTHNREDKIIKPYYELGSIAGSRNWLYPTGWKYIDGVNDGCVSVESTKIEGLKDHITLPVQHGDMGWDTKVRKQIIHFLKNGFFSR